MRPEHFALVRFSSLGDVVLVTAAASYLKAQRPSAGLCVVTKAAFAPLLQGHPAIDEVLVLEQVGGLVGLAWALRRRGVTAVLDLHANLRSRALGLLSALPVTRWNAGTLDRRLRVHAKRWKGQELGPVTERYVGAAAKLLGQAPPLVTPLPTLQVSAEGAAWAEAWLRDEGWQGEPLLAVAPGAAWPSKRTSIDILRDSLAPLPAGVRVLLLGSALERGLCDELAASLPDALNAAGETQSLQQLLALTAKAKAFFRA